MSRFDKMILGKSECSFAEIKGAYMKAAMFYNFVHPSFKCCKCKNGEMCEVCVQWEEYISQFDDYAELMLLFAMKENENKIWDIKEEKWIEYNKYQSLYWRTDEK